ncbi:MAG: hypothetical protein MJE77_00025 [Proteobacteria bacterium]|nr:hypothetical protein [Pseudomonadota bacterium]
MINNPLQTPVKPDGSGRDTGPTAPSPGFLELVRASRGKLEETFVRGATPDLEALVGWEFRGANTTLLAGLLGIKKFIKGFYRAPADRGLPGPATGKADGDLVYGYNCSVRRNRLDGPWQALPSHDQPRRFGFFLVHPVDPTGRDNAYLHALLLDYSRGNNRSFDPANGLRDYLVEVREGGDKGDRDSVLYLGKAYYALGPARPAVSFFVLERLRRGPVSPRF